jgi:transposase-like protein
LEALQEKESGVEISRRYNIHVNQVSLWKKALMENSPRLFEDSHPEKDERDRKIASQNREIATLTEDMKFLKKKLKPYL